MTRPTMRFLPCGDSAFLVEVDDLDSVLRLDAMFAANELIESAVPGARTVLIRMRPGAEVSRFADWLGQAGVPEQGEPAGADDSDRPETVVPVVYDGDDLADVAELTGLSTAEVIERHQATAWRVAFTGFAPGFGYLVGGDGSLEVPRRAESRTRVPAGAVGLAGEFSGVYPRESPGGWQLIGRTDAVLWDPHRRRPALLAPGDRVRFEAAPA